MASTSGKQSKNLTTSSSTNVDDSGNAEDLTVFVRVYSLSFFFLIFKDDDDFAGSKLVGTDAKPISRNVRLDYRANR